MTQASATSTQIQHVNLMVGDLDAAVDFYTEVLGLGLASTPDLGFPAQFIAINELPGDPSQPAPGRRPRAGPFLPARRRLQRCVRAMPRPPASSTRGRGETPSAWRAA